MKSSAGKLPPGKTKIVCTLGPSTSSPEILVELLDAGVDVARLNFSHGSHGDHLAALRNVRAASFSTGKIVTVLMDLQGPKIRIGELEKQSIELVSGKRLTITTTPTLGTSAIVSTTYRKLPTEVRTNDTILLDDGKLRLRVVGVRGNDVITEVVVGGVLSSHKGMNLPGVSISAPALTAKDLQDLKFGLQHGVDYVALSFVRRAEDLRTLRHAIRRMGGKAARTPIIAKIEKPQAVANIDAIIEAADGIMVARGDLGVEMPPEDVPLLQKSIIRKCNQAGKPVIVATQMLESMIANPTPTRAEASDVANAVVDGVDAVMLSGETSIGKYPVEAVQMMNRIIRKVESERSGTTVSVGETPVDVENRLDAIARSACVLAGQMKAAAIVVVSHSGETARVLSRYRPASRIIAIADNNRVLQKLNILWGVEGMQVEMLDDNSDKALQKIQRKLVKAGIVKRGDHVVVLAGQPFFARSSANFIKVERIS